MKIKAFIILTSIACSLAATAQKNEEGLTQTSDSRISAIVNSEYTAGCKWKRITFAQKCVDYLRTINYDIPAYGRQADGTYRRGPFLVGAAIHSVVDRKELHAAYEECITRIGGIKLKMPSKGEMEIVGATDRNLVGTYSKDDVRRVFNDTKTQISTDGEDCRVLQPLYAYDHTVMGVAELHFRGGEPEDRIKEAASSYVRMLAQWTPDYGELMSPFDEGFKPDDMLCQKINQIILARHPELLIYSIHIANPADPKKENRHYAINRPNFHKESGPFTLDTEVTGKVFVVMLPYSHHMEIHLPLIDKKGNFVGVIVCGYLYDSMKEGVDYFGRSLSLMDETTKLLPEDFADLFKP